MQPAGVLEDERGDLQDEFGGLLWQVTHDMIEQFMLGFMEIIMPLTPVTAVPSTWSSLMTAVPTQRRNSMPSFRTKVTRNPAVLNGTFRHRIKHRGPTCHRFFLSSLSVSQLCVSFPIKLLFRFAIWPLLGPSSGRGRCDREEVFQPKQGSSTWGTL
jgi:hypothetical protein